MPERTRSRRPASSPPTWLGQHPPWLRYLIVLVALGLIVYEAVGRTGEPRWTLLVLYTGMVGLTSLYGVGRGPAPPSPPPEEYPR